MKIKTLPRIVAVLLTLAMLLALSSCSGCQKENDPVFSAPPVTTTTTQKPVDKTLNPLTGAKDMTTDNNRPIGFVVTDESSSLTQLNIESADMYFEAETEAGIPRMLAIYSSVDRIPDTIGPVRSARPHFVKFAKSLDAIYCHVGGSTTGRITIEKLGVDNVDSVGEVNAILKNSANVSWNRTAFPKANVLARIKQKGYSTTTDPTPLFNFGDKAGTIAATTVDVKISASYKMAFTYNAETGLYEKHRNALTTPIHTTYTGGTITAKNILVMFGKRVLDERNDQRCNYELDRGTGLLINNGTCRPITWTRPTSEEMYFYEEDGTTKLTVAEGKTYVCLTSDAYKDMNMVS